MSLVLTIKSRVGEFNEPTCSWAPRLSDSLFPFCIWRGTFSENMRTNVTHGYCNQQMHPVAQGWPPCLRAITATTLLVKAAKEIIVGSSLTISAPHAREALLNSHQMQHFQSVASHPRQSFCKLLFIQLFHVMITLTLLTFLPFITNKAPHDWLTPHGDLQQTFLGNPISRGSLMVLI